MASSDNKNNGTYFSLEKWYHYFDYDPYSFIPLSNEVGVTTKMGPYEVTLVK